MIADSAVLEGSIRTTLIAKRAAAKVVGDQGLMELDHPSMGSEDFAYYLQRLPGCYVRFGARIADREYTPLHSPSFDIDEEGRGSIREGNKVTLWNVPKGH